MFGMAFTNYVWQSEQVNILLYHSPLATNPALITIANHSYVVCCSQRTVTWYVRLTIVTCVSPLGYNPVPVCFVCPPAVLTQLSTSLSQCPTSLSMRCSSEMRGVRSPEPRPVCMSGCIPIGRCAAACSLGCGVHA